MLNYFLRFHTSCGQAQIFFTTEVPKLIKNCRPGNIALARHGCKKGMSLSLFMSFTIALTATFSPYLHPWRIQHSQSTKPTTSE